MKYQKAIKIVFLLVLIVFVQFACNLEKQYETRENIHQEEAAMVKVTREAVGVELYKANCARCHGETGEGTDKGISFLKGHALHHSEEEFIKQVANGEKDEMPAFKDKLTEAEIKAVVKYVREEIQKNSGEKENKPHKH